MFGTLTWPLLLLFLLIAALIPVVLRMTGVGLDLPVSILIAPNTARARWWHPLPDGRLQCDLCPLRTC